MKDERQSDSFDADGEFRFDCRTCNTTYLLMKVVKKCPICGKKGLEEI